MFKRFKRPFTHKSSMLGPFLSSSPAARRPTKSDVNPFSPNLDAPPAYTPGSSRTVGTTPRSASPSTGTDEDEYGFLKSFDTVFLVDDSGSMAGRSWRETGAALETITPICVQRDADGVDIYFLNRKNEPHFSKITSPNTVVKIFKEVRPGGATPTGDRLNQILWPYLNKYEKDPEGTKPMNVIVITDGAATDDVESTVIQCAKKLDKLKAPAWQVGIQFFQVGKDEKAREYLKQLDDGLGELAGNDDLRDIVDTVPFTGDNDSRLSAIGIMKVVLGSVNRRLDRNSKELHRD